MRYIFNSAVTNAFGQYDYSPLSIEEAQEWIKRGEFLSTIRYPQTAEALALLTGAHIPVSNITVAMQPGDEALVFRLVFPPGTPRLPDKLKGKVDIDFLLKNCEIGLMKRLK